MAKSRADQPCVRRASPPCSPRSPRCPESGRGWASSSRSWPGPLVVDLLWHLPLGVIDRRNAPEVAEARAGDGRHAHRHGRRAHRAAQPAPALRVWCSDETGRLSPRLLQRPRGLPQEAAAARRDGASSAAGSSSTRASVQMTHPDHVVPLEERESILRVEPVYGLTAGLTPAAAAEGDRRRRRARARAAGMAGRGLPEAAASGPAGRRRSPPRMPRPTKPICRRCIRRARGSPSTSCWRASSPSRWCAITTARVAGRSTKGDGALRDKALAALPFQLTPSQIVAVGRDRGRHGQARAHGAAAAGRCRQRQDAGRLAGHADRRRGRRAGRADGADRDPGAPALRHHRAARRSGRRAARAADRPRRPAAEEGDAARPRRRHDPARRRHACAGAGGRRVRRPRAGRGRRAAPLRRAPAHGAARPRARPSTCW